MTIDPYVRPADIERKPTGLFYSSGSELTQAEARQVGIRPRPSAKRNPTAVVLPRYEGLEPMVREDMRLMFTAQWRGTTAHPTLDDVTTYIRENGLEPVGSEPFRDPPVLDEYMRTEDRLKALTQYEEARATSAKSRALFDINGCPMFVPSDFKPSDYDTGAERASKLETIREHV